MSFVRQWMEQRTLRETGDPMDLELEEEPLTPEPKPEEPAPDRSDKESMAGIKLGNLGARIVGTLSAWTDEGGFLNTVKNPDVLEAGVGELRETISDFNRVASRVMSQSTATTAPLRSFQSPWLTTLGLRLQEIKSRDSRVKTKAKTQLALLSQKIAPQWDQLLQKNELGIRVTNPSLIEPPLGPPEE